MIETTNTAFPVCPHCGCVHRDAAEWGFDADQPAEPTECDACGKKFLLEVHMQITYSTSEPKP